MKSKHGRKPVGSKRGMKKSMRGMDEHDKHVTGMHKGRGYGIRGRLAGGRDKRLADAKL